MVNPDSDLARAHPDWILRGRMALPPSARQQQVLDLAHPEAYAYVAGRLHALLDEYPIAYLKWDHNRDLRRRRQRPGGRRPGPRAHPRASTACSTSSRPRTPGSRSRAARRAARASTSASSIAPTASGPATASTRSSGSTNQRYTALRRAARADGHAPDQPRRALDRAAPSTSDLSAAVALFGHFGIEWDLTDDRRRDPRVASPHGSRSPSASARSSRPAGRSTSTAPTRASTSAASSPRTRSSAVFTITQTDTTVAYPPGRVRIPGLDPGRRYRSGSLGGPTGRRRPSRALEWRHHDVALTGRELDAVGLRPPVQYPQQIHRRRADRRATEHHHQAQGGAR